MRDRRGSYDDFSKMDVGPGSPRDSASVLGNLEMENSFGRGGERGERRQYRQAVNPEVHGAIDHFIRSEQRLVLQCLYFIISLWSIQIRNPISGAWCSSSRYISVGDGPFKIYL